MWFYTCNIIYVQFIVILSIQYECFFLFFFISLMQHPEWRKWLYVCYLYVSQYLLNLIFNEINLIKTGKNISYPWEMVISQFNVLVSFSFLVTMMSSSTYTNRIIELSLLKYKQGVRRRLLQFTIHNKFPETFIPAQCGASFRPYMFLCSLQTGCSIIKTLWLNHKDFFG